MQQILKMLLTFLAAKMYKIKFLAVFSNMHLCVGMQVFKLTLSVLMLQICRVPSTADPANVRYL
jgi:hypothetical protein